MTEHLSRRAVLALGAALPVVGFAGLSRASAAAPHPLDAPPPGASAFSSIVPARLADTRPEQGVGGYTRIDANTIRVVVAGRNAAKNEQLPEELGAMVRMLDTIRKSPRPPKSPVEVACAGSRAPRCRP